MRVSLIVAVAVLGGVQSVPERTLPAATLEFREAFTGIGSVRELSDGRVLVLDREDKMVNLVDLARSSSTPVGRQGGGPGEYKSPSRLIPLRGDTTVLVDPGLQRSIVISPSGVAGDVLLNAGEMVSAPGGARVPQAADALGRLYFTASGFAPGADLSTLPDSVLLLRLDRRTGRVDTLARLKQARPNILIDREGSRIKSVNIRKVPFMPHDDWAVFPDGRVILVRTDPFRIDQRAAGGALTRGPRIAYLPIPVVEADRGAAIDPLPKFKPPFDGPSTFLAPDGRVWVRRTTAAADSTARYDVFDASGRVSSRVSLPPRTRIAGFGKASIYVVRRDEDDLEYLGRLGLPPL